MTKETTINGTETLDGEEQEFPDQEEMDEIKLELADELKEDPEEFRHFVVHSDSGKVEILNKLQPGVVSYTYDPMAVTPRDIRYILEATYDGSRLEVTTDAKILLLPLEGMKKATVVLDIRNRSNIEIGTMELWRYGK